MIEILKEIPMLMIAFQVFLIVSLLDFLKYSLEEDNFFVGLFSICFWVIIEFILFHEELSYFGYIFKFNIF